MRLLTVSVLIVCMACTSRGDTDSVSSDSTALDTTFTSIEELAPTEVPIPDTIRTHVEVGYNWPDAYRKGQQFEPFRKVYDQAALIRRVIDSVFNASQGVFNDSDSVLLRPTKDRTYQAILAYAEQLRSGIKIEKGKAPDRSNAYLNGEDQSTEYLPESGSTLHNDIDFMFLGGGPFIEQDDELYKDSDGNPEAHYTTDIPENGQYFFN